jgi:uncharacterized protein YlxP (DUF503 family)
MKVGLLLLHVQFPGSDSLKAKRHRLKPLLARLQKEFNISAAEVDYLEQWQDSLIGCTVISNEISHVDRSLQKIGTWLEKNWHDVDVVDEQIEILR